ncbi:glycerol kinase [Ditylenchus destructor]|uniref:Glycerol kinase n=1 Tax=Ditylenchus destructor TaxID=166010 RepID=A0AAD4MFM7_9BILA|nr:glycerol kinase [Ditylenchus destructor]
MTQRRSGKRRWAAPSQWSRPRAAPTGSPRSHHQSSARRSSSGQGHRRAARARHRVARTGAARRSAANSKEAGEEPGVQARTGLLLDHYFSGTKIAWAMANWPQLREAGDRLAIGTVESWLVWKLTANEKRGGLHITDATNASRTLLMGLGSGGWSDGLIDLFGPPPRRPGRDRRLRRAISAKRRGFGGPIPICGMAGGTSRRPRSDKPVCHPGDTKATFGNRRLRSSPMPASANPRRSTGCSRPCFGSSAGGAPFAIEGSVFVAGSVVKWLRDSLGLIESAGETEVLARSVPDNGGVYFVPALTGLGAPWWEPEARGAR